jgi:hypothetical protein
MYLAAFGEFGTVIAAVLGILYIVGQVMSREDKGRVPQRRPAPRRGPAGAQRPAVPRPAAPRAGMQAGAKPRAAQDPRTEVERFLREVTARRAQPADRDQVELLERPAGGRAGGGGAAPAAPAAPRVPAAQPGGAQRAVAREAAQRAPRAREVAVEVEVVREPLGSGVGEHVMTHLGARLTDERTKQRVHEHLDHRLGTIRTQGETPGRAVAEARVAHPLSLLRSPASLREAIVLSEILSEPVSLRPPR